MAFCQHHGIPTNLVDVSYSPLVALFFACDGKSERKFTLSEFIGNKSIDDFEKDVSCQSTFIHNLINQVKKPFYSSYAQIYMLNKERLINITDLIVELSGRNLFEELLTDEILMIKLLEAIKEHFKPINRKTLNIWLKNILEEYVRVNELNISFSSSDELYSIVKAALKSDDINYKDIFSALKNLINSSYIKRFSSMNQ